MDDKHTLARHRRDIVRERRSVAGLAVVMALLCVTYVELGLSSPMPADVHEALFSAPSIVCPLTSG